MCFQVAGWNETYYSTIEANSHPMRLGKILQVNPGQFRYSSTLTRLEPGALGVRLASIATTDGVHCRSKPSPTHKGGEDDPAWWKARAPPSSVLIYGNGKMDVLAEPVEAMRRMLLCPSNPIVGHLLDAFSLLTFDKCVFNNTDDCECVVGLGAGSAH